MRIRIRICTIWHRTNGSVNLSLFQDYSRICDAFKKLSNSDHHKKLRKKFLSHVFRPIETSSNKSTSWVIFNIDYSYRIKILNNFNNQFNLFIAEQVHSVSHQLYYPVMQCKRPNLPSESCIGNHLRHTFAVHCSDHRLIPYSSQYH